MMKVWAVTDYGMFYGVYSTLEKATEKARKEYPYMRQGTDMEYIVECELDKDWQ
jgi:hypothetical protein